MKLPKIISYYTDGRNDWYIKCAKELEEQCKLFNFDYYIEKKQSLGNYDVNCKIKPKFVMECLDKFKCPLIFLDIDATLTGNIPEELYDIQKYDIVIAKCNGIKRTQEEENNILKNIKNPLLPRSIYIRDVFIFFNYNEKSYNFLKTWDNICLKNKQSDHCCLNATVCQQIDNTNIKILPEHVNIAYGNNIYPKEKTFCYYRVSGALYNK